MNGCEFRNFLTTVAPSAPVLQNRYYGNPSDEIIEAPPCEKCGAERLACVMGVEQQSGPVDPIWYGWRLWCQNCEQFDARWTVRFAFGRNRAGVWRLYVREGFVMDGDAMNGLGTAISTLAHIDEVREARLKNGNGKWAIQVRADGSVWLPYCRTWRLRREGEPVQVRPGKLREGTRRSCYSCNARLEACAVWRPMVSSAAGWTGLSNLVVCLRCVHAAEPSDGIERRVVEVSKGRSLVVFTGGAS